MSVLQAQVNVLKRRDLAMNLSKYLNSGTHDKDRILKLQDFLALMTTPCLNKRPAFDLL